MNKTFKNFLAAAAVFTTVTAARADVSFLIDGDLLRNSSGVAIPQSSLFLLVASTSDSIFSTLKEGSLLSVGSIITGAGGDDTIVYKGDISSYGVNGVLNTSTPGINFSIATGWNAGDSLALIWFPTLTISSSTLSAGTPYGIYTNASAVDGSSVWITPSSPSTNYKLLFYTKAGSEVSPGASASNAATAGNASLTVAAVPEPSTFAMLGIGMGLAGWMARRKKA